MITKEGIKIENQSNFVRGYLYLRSQLAKISSSGWGRLFIVFYIILNCFLGYRAMKLYEAKKSGRVLVDHYFEYKMKIAEGTEKGEDVSQWKDALVMNEEFGDVIALKRENYKNAYIHFFFWGLLATPIFCGMLKWIYLGFKRKKDA